MCCVKGTPSSMAHDGLDGHSPPWTRAPPTLGVPLQPCPHPLMTTKFTWVHNFLRPPQGLPTVHTPCIRLGRKSQHTLCWESRREKQTVFGCSLQSFSSPSAPCVFFSSAYDHIDTTAMDVEETRLEMSICCCAVSVLEGIVWAHLGVVTGLEVSMHLLHSSGVPAYAQSIFSYQPTCLFPGLSANFVLCQPQEADIGHSCRCNGWMIVPTIYQRVLGVSDRLFCFQGCILGVWRSLQQRPRTFSAMSGSCADVPKSNRFHGRILRFTFVEYGYILYIPVKSSAIFLQCRTPTVYFPNSTASSVTNCCFPPIIALALSSSVLQCRSHIPRCNVFMMSHLREEFAEYMPKVRRGFRLHMPTSANRQLYPKMNSSHFFRACGPGTQGFRMH